MITLSLSDYEITQNGDIINKRNGRKIKPQKNDKGYLRVSIGGKLMFVHRLVAEKYVPNPNNKPQVNHIDGNKLNNNYTNLEWTTNKENRQHALTHNLHLCGEQCNWSKLNEEAVIYIRKNKNIFSSELAKKFNVSVGAINSVKYYQTWKHLKRYAELPQNEVVEV